MNGHTIYPGYYGPSHKAIYDDFLAGITFESKFGMKLDLNTDLLYLRPMIREVVMGIICGDYADVKDQGREFFSRHPDVKPNRLEKILYGLK